MDSTFVTVILLNNTCYLVTHQKRTKGICQCIYSVLLLGRVQLLVGHARLPPWLLMQGFNCERIVLLNFMRLVYISPDSKGYSGSVHATWTHVGSLLYVGLLEQGCWTKMTSRSPFQPQQFCDSGIPHRITSPSCASILYSWGINSTFCCCCVFSEQLAI